MFLAEREQRKHAHTREGLWHTDLNPGNEELAWSNSHKSSENILCGIIYCEGSFLHLLGIILRHKEIMSTFLSVCLPIVRLLVKSDIRVFIDRLNGS